MTEQNLNQTLKKRRQKKVTLLKIILPLLFWSLWGAVVYFLSPNNPLTIGLFFLFLTLGIFTLVKLLSHNLPFAIITTSLICLALLLRFFRLEDPFNLGLIALILVLSIVYLRAKRQLL